MIIGKSFQNDEEWSCDSTLGCRVTQDFDLCKLDEIETEERVNQELLSERSTADKETDSELQTYMDEPLADEEWLKNYRQQQEGKSKEEEVLKKRQADETRTGDW